jgi:DNA repair exonuclease SbcCD ATPase subunit
MDEPQPNYRREFLTSPQHVWMGLLTLGAGFVTGHPLELILGATAYAIGWIYLPDAGFFKGWVDRREAEAKRQAAWAEVNAFIQRRDALLASLSESRRERYDALAQVCENIESASASDAMAAPDPDADPRVHKLDELMWTFLRLLTIEESLERFLETERQEQLPNVVAEAEQEIARLSAEIEALKDQPAKNFEAKERFLESRKDRLEVLRKRLERSEQAQENLALVKSEQQRLEEQIKLIRADAVASKNAATLTARIDATVEHLDQTNKWLAEMDEFKDLVGEVPDTEFRVGFGAAAPPPLPGVRRMARTRQKQ